MFTNELILTNESHKRTFLFDYSFSNINIRRIVVNSLIGMKPNKENKKTSFPLNLGAHIKADQYNPIIEFNELIVPEENRNKMTSTSLGNYVTELIIELKFQDIEPTKTEVVLFFETTPGVKY